MESHRTGVISTQSAISSDNVAEPPQTKPAAVASLVALVLAAFYFFTILHSSCGPALTRARHRSGLSRENMELLCPECGQGGAVLR